MNIQIQDKNVLNVMARFKERSEAGIKKYKTTLERTDLSNVRMAYNTHKKKQWTLFFTWSDLKHEYKQSK
jgi:hypothetical protein